MNSYTILAILFGFVLFAVTVSLIHRKNEDKKKEKWAEDQLKDLLNNVFVPVSESDTGSKECKDNASTETKPEKFVPKSAFGDGKCLYCGKILDGIGGNPNDYGLHSEYVDFSDKCVCPRCDELVTQTNRCIKDILDHDENPEPYFSTLIKHIGDVSDHYDELKNRKSYFSDK